MRLGDLNGKVAFCKVSIQTIDYFLDFIIRESMFALDERFIDSGMKHFSGRIKLHGDTKRRLGASWMEGTEIVGKMLRKHGNNFIRRIYAGSPMVCLAIERGIFCDILGYIRDMDSEFVVSVWELLDGYGIIEVFCIRSVDRDNPFVPEVHSSGSGYLWMKFFRFLEYGLRKLFDDSILVKYDSFGHSLAILVPEDGYYFPMGFVFVPKDPDGDDLIVFRFESVPIADKYVFSSESFDYLHKSVGALGTFDVLSDQNLFGTLHERDDFCLGFFPLQSLFSDLNLHGIAIQCPLSLPFPDEKNLPFGSFDESEVGLNLGIDTGVIGWAHSFL